MIYFRIKVLRLRYLLLLVSVFFVGLAWSQKDISSLGELPASLKETSGLLYLNGSLITHNDSGNSPELYELNPQNLALTRTVNIRNFENRDWEDLTQDDTYIYIADFGNNLGQRTDLAVLRIVKAEYLASNEVNAERIGFKYPDQTDFSGGENSDFDAEALFVLGDRLIILTKQWQTGGTMAYAIPKTPGEHIARPLDGYSINGLVTGAHYDPLSKNLYLVGYSRFLVPFFATVTAPKMNTIFGNRVVKVNLETEGVAQVEAVVRAGDALYISSEENITPPLVNTAARLFAFTLDEVDTPIVPPDKNEIIVYKRFRGDGLNYRLNTDKPISGLGIFNALGQRVHYIPLEDFSQRPIDISKLGQGLYYLGFFSKNKILSYPFFRD